MNPIASFAAIALAAGVIASTFAVALNASTPPRNTGPTANSVVRVDTRNNIAALANVSFNNRDFDPYSAGDGGPEGGNGPHGQGSLPVPPAPPDPPSRGPSP